MLKKLRGPQETMKTMLTPIRRWFVFRLLLSCWRTLGTALVNPENYYIIILKFYNFATLKFHNLEISQFCIFTIFFNSYVCNFTQVQKQTDRQTNRQTVIIIGEFL